MITFEPSSLIDSLSTGAYTVTRRAASTYSVNGREVGGSTGTIDGVVASVQPASGNDLLRLPEGRRTQETRVVFSSTELLVGGEGTTNEADLVAIDGQTWEVQQVQSWDSGGGNYYRAIVQAVR